MAYELLMHTYMHFVCEKETEANRPLYAIVLNKIRSFIISEYKRSSHLFVYLQYTV